MTAYPQQQKCGSAVYPKTMPPRWKPGFGRAAIFCLPWNWRHAAGNSAPPPSSGRIDRPCMRELRGRFALVLLRRMNGRHSSEAFQKSEVEGRFGSMATVARLGESDS